MSSSQPGLSFFTVLGLIFITLKLTNLINWSWLWVLAPFWIPFAFAGVIAIVAGTIALGVYTKKRYF